MHTPHSGRTDDGRPAALHQEFLSMRMNSQHTALPQDPDSPTDDVAAPSLLTRTLRGVAVGAFSLTFALAGQSVAQADDHRDRWNGESQGNHGSGRGAAATGPTPAAAAPAAGPAAAP